MKWMIASDIHGSALYCRKMLERYQAERADRLLLLGDLLYHGPRNDLPTGYNPKEVIKLLNAAKSELLCVRGNCDTEVDQMVLEFPILADYALLFWENRVVFVTHGHRFHTSTPPPVKKGDIVLHGHTHIPIFQVHDEVIYLNPGSVSIPKQESEHGYLTLEQNRLQWVNLDGRVWKEEFI